MILRPEGYIGSERIAELQDIAGDDKLYNAREFSQLRDRVLSLYTQVRQQTTDSTKREKQTLAQMEKNLQSMSLDQDIHADDINTLFLAITVLLPQTLSAEDKYFFKQAQAQLLLLEQKKDTELLDATHTFNTGIATIEEEVRLSHIYDAVDTYTATEKDGKKRRKDLSKAEKKERQEKDKQLLGDILEEYLGEQEYTANKDIYRDLTRWLGTMNSGIVDSMQTWFAAGIVPTDDTIDTLLTEAAYVPDGRKLDRRETKNILKLYGLLAEHGGADIFSATTDTQPAAALGYILRVFGSHTSLARTLQSTSLLRQLETNDEAGDATTTVRNLIGDINYDGSVVNAPDPRSDEYKRNYRQREKAWESVDKSLVMGTSVRRMMEDAEDFLALSMAGDDEAARAQLTTNITHALASWTGDADLIDIASDTQLLKAYQEKPYLLAASHEMFLSHGADARLIMQYGQGNDALGLPSYTDMLEAIAAQQQAEDTEIVADLLSPEQVAMIDTKLSDCYQELIDRVMQDASLSSEQKGDFVSSLQQERISGLKSMRISTFGAMLSTIKGHEGIGLGAGLTSDTINVWLKDNLGGFVQQMDVSSGVFMTKAGDPSLGVALSFGASHGKKHATYYAFGAGTGVGPAGWSVGPFVVLGQEFQTNSGRIKKTLDAQAAHHIGLAVNANLVSAGGSLYWSRDKLKGYEQGKAAIESSFASVFGVLEDIDDVELQTVVDALEETYPHTSPDTIEDAAYTVLRLIEPFGSRWAEMDDSVKSQIIATLTKRYALARYNQHIEELGEGFSSLHSSQLGAGIQYVAGFFLPAVGVGLRRYRESTYEETPESLAATKEAQEKGYGAREVAEAITPDIIDSINNIFDLADDNKLILHAATKTSPSFFTIPASALSQDGGKLNLHIHPALRPFIATKDEALHIHQQTPITVMASYRQGEVEYDLIIGATGLSETEQVLAVESDEADTTTVSDYVGNLANYEKYIQDQEVLTQVDNLQQFLAGSSELATRLRTELDFRITINESGNIVFATNNDKYGPLELTPADVTGKLEVKKAIDGTIYYAWPLDDTPDTFEITYEVETKTTVESGKQIVLEQLLPKLSSQVENYIRDAGNNAELLALRNGSQRSQWLAYRNAVELGNMADAKNILLTWQQKSLISLENIDALTDTDLRALDAAMSVVQLTKNKIVANRLNNSPEQRMNRAVVLWKSIASDINDTIPGWGSNSISKEGFAEIVAAIAKGTTNYDEYHQYIYHLLDPKGRKDKTNHFMKVTSPVYELVRLLASNKYILDLRTNKLEQKCKQEGLSTSAFAVFKELRKAAVAPVAHRNSYELAIADQSYGMVMGYADDGAIEEKFLPSPELVADATTVIDDAELQRYFLERLPSDSPILLQVEDALGIDRATAIDAIIAREYQGTPIDAQFSLGFYGKCFNETILLDRLIIDIPREEIIEISEPLTEAISTKEGFCVDGVFVNSVGTESQAMRRQKTISFGWIGGDPTVTKEQVVTESYTEIKDFEEFMVGLSEEERQAIIDAMGGTIQPGYEVIINGQKYMVDGWAVGNNLIVFKDITGSGLPSFKVYNTVTHQFSEPYTIWGPYGEMMQAIASKGLEIKTYTTHIDHRTSTIVIEHNQNIDE